MQAKILIIANIIIYVCINDKIIIIYVKMEISNYLILKLRKRKKKIIFFFVLFEFLKTQKNLKRNRLTE